MISFVVRVTVAIVLLLSVPNVAVCAKKGASSRPKSVAVRGYYRKDGTYVRPHYRSAPRSSGTSSIPVPQPHGSSYATEEDNGKPAGPKKEIARTTARTSARTSYSHGIAGLFDDDSDPANIVGPAAPAVARSQGSPRQPREARAVRFHVRFADGTIINAADVQLQKDRYILELPKGGARGYAKTLVESIEPAKNTTTKDRVVLVHRDGTLETYGGFLIRLLGVSLSEPAGIDRLMALVTNEPIDIAYDRSLAKIAHRDDAGCLLGYVTRSRDKLDINAALLREGMATVDRSRALQRSPAFEKYASEGSR
jgi:hypothetical protein